MNAPDRIWLEPEECADPAVGRLWCKDQQTSEDEHGEDIPWRDSYVRADIHAAAIARTWQAALEEAATFVEECACDAGHI